MPSIIALSEVEEALGVVCAFADAAARHRTRSHAQCWQRKSPAATSSLVLRPPAVAAVSLDAQEVVDACVERVETETASIGVGPPVRDNSTVTEIGSGSHETYYVWNEPR